MRYHFFLHYGWFFQNLGKEAVRTFMHTTIAILFQKRFQPNVNNLMTQLHRRNNFIVENIGRKILMEINIDNAQSSLHYMCNTVYFASKKLLKISHVRHTKQIVFCSILYLLISCQKLEFRQEILILIYNQWCQQVGFLTPLVCTS